VPNNLNIKIKYDYSRMVQHITHIMKYGKYRSNRNFLKEQQYRSIRWQKRAEPDVSDVRHFANCC